MIVEQVLIIIRLSLELALLVVQDMTPEQRQRLWAEHEKRMDFWNKLLERIKAGEPS